MAKKQLLLLLVLNAFLLYSVVKWVPKWVLIISSIDMIVTVIK